MGQSVSRAESDIERREACKRVACCLRVVWRGSTGGADSAARQTNRQVFVCRCAAVVARFITRTHTRSHALTHTHSHQNNY